MGSLQLGLPLPLLLPHGERVLVVRGAVRVRHGHISGVRGGVQHLRAVSVPRVQEDEGEGRGGGGSEDSVEDQPAGDQAGGEPDGMGKELMVARYLVGRISARRRMGMKSHAKYVVLGEIKMER